MHNKMEPAFLAKPPKSSSSSSSSSSRPAALKGTSRRTGATNTFQDLQASLVRAGMRRAGMPGAGYCKVEPTTSSVGRQEYPSVPPPAAVSKQGRGSHAPSETLRESGRVTTSTTAGAAAAVPAKWVWGQGPEEEEEEAAEKGPQHRQPHLAPVAHDLGGDAASKPPPPPGNIDVLRKKMFADSSSSFESTCSTEAMTESTTSSPKDANWDAPFLSRLSDMSMKFPEPPTRPPAETTPPSSRALTISGLGKNITSSLPSVQLLMPLRWRKRVRATGSNKRCRKSTSRWIARSKATSSMSETSLLARALSVNDNGVHRGKEAAAPGAKPKPSSFAVESAVVMTPPRRWGVSKVAGGTPRQLSDLSEVNEQQEEEQQEEEEEEARSVCDPPSALPTPVPHPAAEKSPPPAPLHTAPRPLAPQKQQRYNVAALLAARHSSRLRRNCFASSPSAAGTDETCFASSPSSLSPPPYMTIKNRLASSSSSIFEEDGDDNKKTLFLNPYSRSPLPPPAAAAAAGDAPRTSAGGAKATAAAAAKKNKPGATHDPTSSSDSWVWRGRSSNNPTNMQQQQKQQQHRHSLFATGAPVDGVRRRAAVTALQVEANRQFGDRRRRVKDGESGIWLPSPGIWSSARRPTPLNADLFSAW